MQHSDLFDGDPLTPTPRQSPKLAERKGKPNPAFDAEVTLSTRSVKSLPSEIVVQRARLKEWHRFLWATTRQLQRTLPRERWYSTWSEVAAAVLARCGEERPLKARSTGVASRFFRLASALRQVPAFGEPVGPVHALPEVLGDPETYVQALVHLAVVMESTVAQRAFFAIVVAELSVDEYARIQGLRPSMAAFLANHVLRHVARFAFDLEVTR